MLKSANWIREDLKRHPRIVELLSFVAGSNPTGGSIYKDGYIDVSQNISTPLAQVMMLIHHFEIFLISSCFVSFCLVLIFSAI